MFGDVSLFDSELHNKKMAQARWVLELFREVHGRLMV